VNSRVRYARSTTAAITEGPHRYTRTGFWSRLVLCSRAVATTLAVYSWIVNLLAHGRSAAALNMPEMGMIDIGKYWAFPGLQASGLTGLLFAYLSVVLGLQQSGRAGSWFPLTYRQINRIHRQVSLMVIGLVLIHVAATVFDAMGNTSQSVLIQGAVAATGWPAAAWASTPGSSPSTRCSCSHRPSMSAEGSVFAAGGSCTASCCSSTACRCGTPSSLAST
jgi:hypothetical protein